MRAARSFGDLDPGMRTALEQAWASARAGSLGIGAAACDPGGRLVATGRNRINETDPGDDVLAGSSVAHAEMNVLAKLGYRAHERLELHTTLQPCVQCLGAIRLSSVSAVRVLAPDPLFRGIERMRDLTPFLGRRWPDIEQRAVDRWSAFALLYPTHHMLDHPTLGAWWTGRLPTIAELAADVAADGRFVGVDDVVAVAELLWDDLGSCVAEVVDVAGDPGPAG